MKRRELIATAAGALAAAVLAGGVAWAAIPTDGGVYTACMLKNVGTVRLIDRSLPPANLMSHCKPALEVEISWNQRGVQGLQGIQGPPGKDGLNGSNGIDGRDGAPGKDGADGQDGEGVTGEPEPAGANCANGGSRFTVANGVTYACNGVNAAGPSVPTICDGAFGAPAHDVAGCTVLRLPARNGGPDEDVTTTALTGGVPGQTLTVTLLCVPFCNTTQRAILGESATLALAGNAVIFPGDTVQLVLLPGTSLYAPFWAEVGRSDN